MPEPATVGQALMHARSIGVDRLDAQLLLARQLGRPRSWLLAHEDAPLVDSPGLLALLARRAAGEPLAYLVGEREFHGLLLHITPDVLVPRPDTETLVDWALELLVGIESPTVADLGTGSGAIALAIKQGCPRAQVHASDVSPAALAVAAGNGQRLALPVAWHQGSWWQAFDVALTFDMILANPPYVAPKDSHLAALRYEPPGALVSGDGGLADLGLIIAGAGRHLCRPGWLLLEHGHQQAQAVHERLRAAGFEALAMRCDLAGRPRASAGRLVAQTS